jgi:two-component system, sensor histidine kinase SagS
MNSSEKAPNRRILVVDDEVDVLDFLKIYLESLSWEAVIVGTTAKAFDMLEHERFFLILSDIAMPEMDGYEFVGRLTAKNIPSQMIFMTGFGYNPNHTLVKLNKTSQHACLFKPFNRARLSAAVKNAYDVYHTGIEPEKSQL